MLYIYIITLSFLLVDASCMCMHRVLNISRASLSKITEEVSIDNTSPNIKKGGGLLFDAIENDDFKMTEYILNKGANPNGTCIKKVFFGDYTLEEEVTPLIWAAQRCSSKNVELLLKAGAIVDDKKFYNPMNFVVAAQPHEKFKKQQEPIKLSTKSNDSIPQLKNLEVPLHIQRAAEDRLYKEEFRKRQEECIDLLIKYIDINQVYGGGNVLHIAADHSNAHLIPHLLSYDANPNARSYNNAIPLVRLLLHCNLYDQSDLKNAVTALLKARSNIYRPTWQMDYAMKWVEDESKKFITFHKNTIFTTPYKEIVDIIKAFDASNKQVVCLPDHVMSKIFELAGKKKPKTIAAAACVNKNCNKIVTDPHMTKTIFFNFYRGIHTQASKDYHDLNRKLITYLVRNDIAMVRFLLQEPYVDVNYRHRRNEQIGLYSCTDIYTPLLVTIQGCYRETMELLLNKGANPNARITFEPLTCLIMAPDNRNQLSCLQLLIQHKIKVNKVHPMTGANALHTAIEYGKFHLVQPLVNARCSVVQRDKDKDTPFGKLLKYRNTYKIADMHPAVKSFLKTDNDRNQALFDLKQALSDFVSKTSDPESFPATIKLLIDAGQNFEIKTLFDSLIHTITTSKSNEKPLPCLQLLVDHEININRTNPMTNENALHVAIKHGKLHLIRSLINAGCDVNKRDNDGDTPFMKLLKYRKKHKTTDMGIIRIGIKAFLEANSDLYVKNNKKQSVISYVKNIRNKKNFAPYVNMITEAANNQFLSQSSQ